MILKQAIKTVANSRDLNATFMPKPIVGINGSGMHTHQSLFNAKGENLFYAECLSGVVRDLHDDGLLRPFPDHF
jgi:glutamine synthetase